MAVGEGHVFDLKRSRARNSTTSSNMSAKRIAVAGTGGLALLIANRIAEDTIHHVILLSRTPRPDLSQIGFQVTAVNYNDPASLHFALLGIDTVISTVSGQNQIALIRAAVQARVLRFAPAEFEGPPIATDPKQDARIELQRYADRIRSTIFVCGILYERFHPSGLAGARMGRSSGLGGQGHYIMDCENMSAQIPLDSAQRQTVTINMTAAQDVARFVTRALDLTEWPPELYMIGERVNVSQLVLRVQQLRGRQFNPCTWHTPAFIRTQLQTAHHQGDRSGQLRLYALLKTAEGHYNYPYKSLNESFPDVEPINFETWFRQVWRIPA